MGTRFPGLDTDTYLFGSNVQTRFDRRRGSVNVTDYGAKGDGTTDDLTAIMAAIAAVPEGGRVIFSAGTYLHNGEIKNLTASATRKAVTLDLTDSAKLLWTGNGTRAIGLEGGWDTTTAVSGLTTGTVTEASVTQATVIASHAGTMPWKRGDIVKVFSDDMIPGTRGVQSDSTLARSGQFMTVYSVGNGSTTFYARLRDPLTTNIRMARIRSMQLAIEGGELDLTDAAIASAVTGEMVGISAAVGPRVSNLTIRRSPSQGITMASCVNYVVENTSILWAWNDGATRFGYAVNDNASTGGRVRGCSFYQVRHGFTDSNTEIAAGTTSPTAYGRSIGWTVSDSSVDSPTSTGWDAHAGGQGGSFANLNVYNAAIGFALRGREHRIINGRASGCTMLARLFSETVGGDSWGHTIDGLYGDSTDAQVEFVNNTGASNPNQNVRETRAHFVRGVSGKVLSGYRFRGYNATVTISDTFADYTGSVTTGQGIDFFQNCNIRGHDRVLDLSNSSGTGAILVDTGTTVDSDVELSSERVLGFSNQSTRLAQLFRSTATTNLRVKGSSNYPIATISSALTTNSFIDWESVINRPGASTSYLPFSGTDVSSGTAGVANLLAVARTRWQDVTVDATLTASVTLANLPAPGAVGQRLTIVNNAASTSSTVLTITHGTTPRTELQGAASKTLTVGQSITLAAMSTGLWKQISAVL